MRTRGRPAGSFKSIHPARVNGKVTKVYSAWQAMIQRCSNPKAHNYACYGGRGIKVCARWKGLKGYDNFVCDVGVPLPGFWLDRRENDGDYTPDNCHWVTPKESANNRRQTGPNVRPESLRQRALAAGLAYHVVYFRIHRLGWTEHQALTTPKLPPGRQTGTLKGLDF